MSFQSWGQFLVQKFLSKKLSGGDGDDDSQSEKERESLSNFKGKKLILYFSNDIFSIQAEGLRRKEQKLNTKC